MTRFAPAAIALALGCAFSTGALATARFEKIVPASPTVTLQGGGVAVKFTVTGSSSSDDNCGFLVNYGDGDSPDLRILNRTEGLLPRTIEHTFRRAGTYSVRIRGERIKFTLGCSGEVSTTINVVASGAAAKSSEPAAKGAAPAAKSIAPAAKAAAPAAKSTAPAAKGPARSAVAVAPTCPAGWMLQANSVDKTTGAYACGPKMPKKKAVCRAGLAYYETAAAVGCRKGK